MDINPLNLFPGKKTYILAIGAMFTALGAFMAGDIALGQFVETMFGMGLAITFRKSMK